MRCSAARRQAASIRGDFGNAEGKEVYGGGDTRGGPVY